MPTKTGYWIRVENGKVEAVWDHEPPEHLLSSSAGWRMAVEVFPDMTPKRETISTYTFNIDAEPAEIVWEKRSIDVDERKDELFRLAKEDFRSVVGSELQKETDGFPETQYNADAVEAARAVFESRMLTIRAAQTHEEVDLLVEG